MAYIDKPFHSYESVEAFKKHLEAGLISPESICFIKGSNQIYTQGSFIGVSEEVIKELETKVTTIQDNLDKVAEYSSKYKGGCVTGTYDTNLCTPPCWIYIQEYDSTPKAWKLLTEKEVKPDGTFEIWFDEPLTSWFAFFNRADYEPDGNEYGSLLGAITHLDYSNLNVSKLKNVLIESLTSLKTVVLPTYFPVLESIDFAGLDSLRTHTKIVVDNPIYTKYDTCSNLIEVDFSGIEIYGRDHICRKCSNLRKVSLFDMRHYDYTDVADPYSIYQLNYNLFLECGELREITCINTDKVANWAQTFRMCSKLKKCDIEDFSATLKFYGTWNRCWALEEMGVMNTEKCTVWQYVFWDCYNLKKIEEIDFSSMTTATQVFYNCKSLKYLKILNLGKSTKTSYDLSEPLNWGTGSEENRQSLVDSLLTYSYDRAAEGMSNCTIKLSSISKALLTEEELLAITNKGFTIS